MVKYEVSSWRATEIKPVEVERETEKTVWVKDPPTRWSAGKVRQRRKDASTPIFDTYDAALEWLIDRATRRHENLTHLLASAADHLRILSRMKEEKSDAA